MTILSSNKKKPLTSTTTTIKPTTITSEEDNELDLFLQSFVERIISKQKHKVKEEKGDHSAVEQALVRLLGPNPKPEDRISTKQLEVILQLDDFLQQEEERRVEMKRRVESLADKAIDLVSGSIKRLE